MMWQDHILYYEDLGPCFPKYGNYDLTLISGVVWCSVAVSTHLASNLEESSVSLEQAGGGGKAMLGHSDLYSTPRHTLIYIYYENIN
jgi:hypothetical protein